MFPHGHWSSATQAASPNISASSLAAPELPPRGTTTTHMPAQGNRVGARRRSHESAEGGHHSGGPRPPSVSRINHGPKKDVPSCPRGRPGPTPPPHPSPTHPPLPP